MSLQLSSTDTSPYAFFSVGTGATPVTMSETLDQTGGTETSAEVEVFIVAEDYSYTGITATCVNETDTGIDLEISLTSGTGFANTVSPSDMDASSADVVTSLFVRAVSSNDGTLTTNDYTAANINVSGTEN